MTMFGDTKAVLNDLLRYDGIGRFAEDRRRRPVALIEPAMGKRRSGPGREEYDVADAESFAD